MIKLALLVVCGLGAAFWLIRSRFLSRTKHPMRPVAGARGKANAATTVALTPDEHLAQLRRDSAIWGVMLRIPAGQGCAEARALKEKRIALERAPRLPLRGCDASECACGYLPLRERRRRDVVPPDGDERRNVGRVTWDQDL